MAYDSIFKTDLFAGQTIIVTGGGSGIGRCTAHELAALGARVLLIGRKADKLQTVAAEIAEDGGVALWQACDIRDEEAVKALVAQVIQAHGQVGSTQTPAALMTQPARSSKSCPDSRSWQRKPVTRPPSCISPVAAQ